MRTLLEIAEVVAELAREVAKDYTTSTDPKTKDASLRACDELLKAQGRMKVEHWRTHPRKTDGVA